jgi:hypothetical protein
MNVQTPELVRFILILLICAPSLTAAPATAPATGPATQPAARPSPEDHRRMLALSRRSIELIKAHRLDEAENVLLEALALFPGHSTNLYNMACIKALKGRSEAALDYLERAAVEGFTDFLHIGRDPDLDSLRDLPRFRDFIARAEQFKLVAAERMIRWLQGEFGEGYIYEIDADSKLIFATNTDAATLAILKQTLVRQAHSQWQDLFEHRHEQYIAIALPSASDFRTIVRRPGVGGFYNHENRILIARNLGQVMTHEFTHALHNADTDPLGQDHAIWVAEGIATMYEAGRWVDGRLIPADNFRLPYIQRSARQNRLIPLARLLAMDQKAFVANATSAYGQSGSIMLFLYEKGLLRKFYDTYKKTFNQDRTARLALEQATGQKLADFEKQWRAWMLSRQAPPMSTGEDGPILGIRFMEANDGLRVEGVIPRGPADRAGIRPGDLVVGIDEIDVRDTFSLIPLLSARQVGDEVLVKLRREGKYLELEVTLAARNTVRP